MDRRERYNDPEEMLRLALSGFQAGLWTAMPGIIESFNAAECTAKVQPSIKAKVTGEDGSVRSVSLPLLLDCPVVFQRGGGFALTFPVVAGDECLVIFASRCIDAWWQSGGIQDQSELRMHDLSDGFVLVGPFSKPGVVSGISTDSVQLRSDDGSTVVEVKSNEVSVTAPTKVTVDSPLTTFTGAVVVQGLLSYEAGLAGAGGSAGSVITGNIVQTGGVMSSEGTVLHTHTHHGVQTGGGNTGGPN